MPAMALHGDQAYPRDVPFTLRERRVLPGEQQRGLERGTALALLIRRIDCRSASSESHGWRVIPHRRCQPPRLGTEEDKVAKQHRERQVAHNGAQAGDETERDLFLHAILLQEAEIHSLHQQCSPLNSPYAPFISRFAHRPDECSTRRFIRRAVLPPPPYKCCPASR